MCASWHWLTWLTRLIKSELVGLTSFQSVTVKYLSTLWCNLQSVAAFAISVNWHKAFSDIVVVDNERVFLSVEPSRFWGEIGHLDASLINLALIDRLALHWGWKPGLINDLWRRLSNKYHWTILLAINQKILRPLLSL